MVRTDWEWILSVNAAALTDQEIEDLFPMVVGCDVEGLDDVDNLKILVKLSQEMLQHKDNQVESLLIECDDLKRKIIEAKSGSNSKRKKSLSSDLVNDRDVDNLSSGGDKVVSSRGTKNEKIATLMSELEAMENENITIKEKLRIVKEEMEEATVHMNQMTEELSSTKEKNLLYKEKLIERERENKALLSQIESIASQQLDRDNVIDEFSSAIDARVTEWKGILDDKDAEIAALRESLSQSMMQSLSSVRDENKSQIIHLNQVINQRDETIEKLQDKLAEAVAEMNESTILIEKLKADAQKIEKSNRRKEQRTLIKKIHKSNEMISSLQNVLAETENDAEIKSKELCQALVTRKRYENGEYGLSEAIEECKTLRDQLRQKDQHVEDLVGVINKLETLNSHQEMEIAALCEKLNLSPGHAIPVDGLVARHEEEMQRAEDIRKENEFLRRQNLEIKSDVRALKYKLKNAGERVSSVIPDRDTTEDQTDLVISNKFKIPEADNGDWVTEREKVALRHVTEIEEIKENVRIVVEENEALRKGMQEILDSVHNQDGSSSVEIQSETLERLLEALDFRHLAGWYHPAMRLQSRLNAVQGSNTELRAQLKQIRSELQKKDETLQNLVLNGSKNAQNASESFSESGEAKPPPDSGGMQAHDIERSEWQKERSALYEEKNELEETITRLEVHLEEYEKNWRVLDSGDDEVRKEFGRMSKESADHAVQIVVLNRKCSILEELISKESSKSYKIEKEAVAADAERKRRLVELEKGSRILEARVATLQSNLANTVSSVRYNELREKYSEACIRLRAALEGAGVLSDEEELKIVEKQKVDSDLCEQIIELNKKLSKYAEAEIGDSGPEDHDRDRIRELEGRITALEIEKESVDKRAKVAEEEARMHAAMNFAKTFEMDSLRHQLLDLQSVSEDKETIARLGFELKNCKQLEAETSRRNVSLQDEVSRLREESNKLKLRTEEAQTTVRECQKQCDARCRSCLDLVDFLQRQYAGSTSLSALDRFESAFRKLKTSEISVQESLERALKSEENVRAQQDLLTGRLQVVEQLKDILEQQIGSPDVQDLIHRFSENSQSMLGELRYKRQINQLENELQTSKSRLAAQESVISTMESEMVFVQKIWSRSSRSEEAPRKPELDVIDIETVSASVQTVRAENRSIETQADLRTIEKPVAPNVERRSSSADNVDSHIVLNERLNQALTLASERSAVLVKCESQIAEYEGKIVALSKQIDEKNSLLEKNEKTSTDERVLDVETPDKIVLRSTVNSLQKIISQKEETILRYQNLLKEDRDEHSKAAARLQEEIKGLHTQMATMQQQVNQKISEYIQKPETMRPVERVTSDDRNKNIDLEEEAEKLNERVSTLEADLSISKELGERWHRLAEERLKHMDHMRARLEEQHKNEIESYRSERDKWQLEADTLRQQLSDNRMQLAKGNSLLTKELQDRENRIHELDIAYHELQNEIEIAEKNTATQKIVAHDSKMQEISNNFGRVQSSQLQAQLDLSRRQIQCFAEKEKNYKKEIVDLKQQLSRRYMAAKTHEQKTSQRETQLERKARGLEEELHTLKLQLEREKFTNENKKLKTAEELALWDKQKRWQQTAEKYKEKLREKSEDYNKLKTNNEKLRAVVSCMEREKWYLRSKLRCENGCIAGSISARPGASSGTEVLDDLQHECLTLRSRVRELTDRLETADTSQLMMKIEAQRRQISALEAVTKGNEYVVDQLERLEATKDVLKKNNLKLESENLELRLEIERIVLDTPRLREKVDHLEKYIELLKVEKSSESSPRSLDKEPQDQGKKTVAELEKTVFTLKRVTEKLQAENKRLRISLKKSPHLQQQAMGRSSNGGSTSSLNGQLYERAQQRVVALETDLQLAEQRIAMLEDTRKEDENTGEIGVLRHQLAHKSELLDKVKQLLTRAAINEKSLRQRVQMLEAKQSLETIPECYVSPPTPDD